MILYNTSFRLFHGAEPLLMVSEQYLITAPGKNYLSVRAASYLGSLSRSGLSRHFYCGWTS